MRVSFLSQQHSFSLKYIKYCIYVFVFLNRLQILSNPSDLAQDRKMTVVNASFFISEFSRYFIAVPVALQLSPVALQICSSYFQLWW